MRKKIFILEFLTNRIKLLVVCDLFLDYAFEENEDKALAELLRQFHTDGIVSYINISRIAEKYGLEYRHVVEMLNDYLSDAVKAGVLKEKHLPV